MNNEEYIKIRYPGVRVFTADTGRINRDKHYVKALLELDITTALQKLKALRVPGKKVSFQAWFIKLLADTVALHPPVNGIHKGQNQVIVFRSVDVSTIVEKAVDGVPVPLPLVLRGANGKTHFQLNDEIQSAIAQSVADEGSLVLGKGENRFLLKLALALPQWLRLFVMRAFILGNPRRVQKMMGTVMVTSLGTVGHMSGWILPSSMHPLSIAIGSINKKPAIHEGEIQKRSILHLTVAVDHDVIDGIPAMRFVDDFVSKLEMGSGLD
jgi:pyruvate/2-oxoglutarate dehydrogenase complex dihydrolipoamide acyltransferase (E2) component